MSKWNHSICEDCWQRLHLGRQPVVLHEKYVETQTCCYCGKEHRSGIFVREAPDSVRCVGTGPEHK
jgi:RNase P subunit RPR2